MIRMGNEKTLSLESLLSVKKKTGSLYVTALVMATCILTAAQETMASTFFDKAKNAVNDVYSQMFGIVTPLFGLIALICLVVILISPGRSFEKAMSWLIRIVIAYVAILTLGWFVLFLRDLTRGGDFSNVV